MTSDSGQPDDPRALRAALRRDLVSAMKARAAETVSALRTAIAAIDNAEAVPPEGTRQATTSSHFAGARAGVGATEAARRELTGADIRAILGDQIASFDREADGYETVGQADAARRLRNQARLLAAYLS
jgi:uncharacterized protein YqeY